jgi:hypothetical protein
MRENEMDTKEIVIKKKLLIEEKLEQQVIENYAGLLLIKAK